MNNIKNIITRAGKFLLIGGLLLATCHIWAQGQRGGGGQGAPQTGGSQRRATQQLRVLEGRIVDPNGEPVAGAVINVAEQTAIVLSDLNGHFSLRNVAPGDEIIISGIGYKVASGFADFNNDFVVTMQYEENEYELLMPVPFGRKPKKFITESSSVVTGTELEKHPVTILQNALTSTVTGVQTYEWSSEPGWSETEIYIRGLRTQNAWARRPLILIDNVERDLSFLDAYPIENITILKDAAATAIYGMKGANGAILVTTKRGVEGKTKVEFTQEVGFQRHTSRMQNEDAYKMTYTRNQVRYLSGSAPLYNDEQIEMYRRVQAGEELPGVDKYKYFSTDWFDDLYRDQAPMYKTNIQVSGGGTNARYYVAASYLRQDGVWNNEYANYNEWSTQARLERWNLRSNLDIDVNRWLNVTLDLGGRMDYIQQPNTSTFNLVTFGAVECDPMQPKFTPTGLRYSSSTARTPFYYIASQGLRKARRRNIYSTVNVTADLSDYVAGLKAYATVSFDSYDLFFVEQSGTTNLYNYDYNNPAVTRVEDFRTTLFVTYSALGTPSAQERGNYSNFNMHGGLKYDYSFGKHYVNASAFVRTFTNSINTMGDNFTNYAQLSSNRYLSYNALAMYVYDGRYIFSGSLSRMGHDNFHPDNRWGTFWGASAGWLLSEESWLKNEKLDLLKLRASYGRAGQAETQNVGTNNNVLNSKYLYQNAFGSATGAAGYGYVFGTSSTTRGNGVKETRVGNRNNIWEISDMANIGLDFDLMNKKLYGSIDAFKEWRSNVLVDRSNIPGLMGAAVAQDSYGKIESRGFEVSLGHHNRIGDFRYYLEGMVTYNVNKIIDLDETPPNVPWQSKAGNRIYDNTEVAMLYEQNFFNNRSIGGWNIYKFVEWATDPSKVASSHEDAIANPDKYPYNMASNGNQTLGTAVFKDLDGDRKIDVNDMTPSVYTIIPDLIPSFTVGVGYKGFDARVVVNAYLNRSVFISPAMAWSGWGNMGTQEIVNTWGYYTDDPFDERNINARWPRPVYGGYESIGSDRSTGSYKNDVWVKTGNYWSLRNIEVGYELPKKLAAKAYMTKVRVYFSAYNVANWSQDLPKELDPEKPMSYLWWYPKVRTYSLGLNINF